MNKASKGLAAVDEPSKDQQPKDADLNPNPQVLGTEQTQTIRALWKSILLVCSLLILGAFALVSWFSALSVAMGALLAVGNFAFMSRVVMRSLLPGNKEGVMAGMLVRYYIRFIITALILSILIWRGWAEPVGLLVGLSVVALSLTVWGIIQARHHLG